MRPGRAVWAAYADCNALQIDCPNCGAQHGNWCTKDDGRVSRVPCVARAAAGSLMVAPGHRDFSQPIHTTDRSQP